MPEMRVMRKSVAFEPLTFRDDEFSMANKI